MNELALYFNLQSHYIKLASGPLNAGQEKARRNLDAAVRSYRTGTRRVKGEGVVVPGLRAPAVWMACCA